VGEGLWDGNAEDSSEEAFPVSPQLAEEVDRRLAEFEADPNSALPWAEIGERIRRLAGGSPL
jgi:putative addiction module component (TIGR02574 family)